MTTWIRILMAGSVMTALACQNNTIELDADAGGAVDDDDDPGDSTTGGSATPPSVSTTGRPPSPATVGTTLPLPGSATSPPDPTVDPPLDTGDDEPPRPPDFVFPPEMPPPVSGIYLLALDTALSPGVPFQALVTVESSDDTLDLALQWLSLDIGSTTSPREPVGDVYTYTGIELQPDGRFVWPTGVVLIPGPANPITGSDVVISAVVDALPLADPYCGDVSGEIITPIEFPLDGTTHAMTEVPGADALPEEFLVSCP